VLGPASVDKSKLVQRRDCLAVLPMQEMADALSTLPSCKNKKTCSIQQFANFSLMGKKRRRKTFTI